MKTYSKIIFAAFAAAFGLASCAQEELAPAEKPQGSLVTVHFGAESQIATTKATLTTDDEQTFKSAWEADDRISVYYLNGADDKGNTVKATWNGQAFSAQLPDYTGTWLYQACFPVPDEKDSHVDFGGARTQKGNSYNSSYDIMVGSADADNAAAGKDDNGNDIVFKMTRQTAIQYFHLKTADFDEAVTKATLTVEGGSIAAQYAYVSDFTFAPTADLKEIEVTFPESAPKASDFSVWFNVLPTATEGNSAVTKMTLTVETASKTLTVTNTKGATYEAGKLYKVVREIPASDWVSKDTPEPEIPVYASLSELVAAGKPSSTATNVTVTLKDEVIKTFNGTKGVNLLVGSQAIQIYCKGAAFPTEWVEGGTISGTLTNCEWVLYGGNTWELCPEDWDELTYTAPTAPIEVPVYASLSELVAAGAPTEAGAQVTVTLKDEEITKFYKTSKGYTNGVYLNVDGQEIEIFCRDVPSAWEIGGLLSGTLTKCDWKIYRGTWELCPENWDELTYTAPLASCETPVITLDGAVATITCATDGATIHYTVGESPADPTESDAVYSSPVTLTDGQTIKAIAVKDGMRPSAVAAKKYTTSGSETGELKTWTYTVTDSSPNFTADAPIVINNATWNIKMGTKVGSPTTNGVPSKYSGVYGWKWGDLKSKYWSSYTLTTSYFQDKKVKSVSVKFLNNGKKTGTMTVSQGSLTIGTASSEFGQSWTVLTSSGGNLGDGGELSITYQVAQASYIGEIKIQYYD